MNQNAPHLAATYAPGSDDYYGVPAVLDTLSPLSPVNYQYVQLLHVVATAC